MGDVSYKDGIDMVAEDIYTYVHESNKLPTTSAVNIEDYNREFSRWHNMGFSIVHFCISSEFSSTYSNACAAAEEVGDVFVVDSRNLSTGQGLLVLRAAEMAADGKCAEDIYNACISLTDKVVASFVVDKLDYLYKGGRCSALSAFGANLLQLKPCIEVKDGKMIPTKKYRGKFEKVVYSYIHDMLVSHDDIDTHRIFLTHTRCSHECLDTARSAIATYGPGFDEVLETTAGATITTHCGPNTLGILFMRK